MRIASALLTSAALLSLAFSAPPEHETAAEHGTRVLHNVTIEITAEGALIFNSTTYAVEESLEPSMPLWWVYLGVR